MRANQVTIKLERFFDSDKLGVKNLEINVYADSNNVYEALSAGFFEVLKQIQDEGNIELPTFGRREHYPTFDYFAKRTFLDFLEKSDYIDQWREYKKESPTLENQFLERMNLKKEYYEYFDKEMRKRYEDNSDK